MKSYQAKLKFKIEQPSKRILRPGCLSLISMSSSLDRMGKREI